jgi:hypothetical protein
MDNNKIHKICKVLNEIDPFLLYEVVKEKNIYRKEAEYIYIFTDNNPNCTIEQLCDSIQLMFIRYYGQLAPVSMCMQIAQRVKEF